MQVTLLLTPMSCLCRFKKILLKYCLERIIQREGGYRSSPTSETPPLTRLSYPLSKGKGGGYRKPHRGLDYSVGLCICVCGGSLITFSLFTHLMLYSWQIIKFAHCQFNFLGKFTDFCTHRHKAILEHFNHVYKIPPNLFIVSYCFPPPRRPLMCFLSVLDLPFLDISREWSHTICSPSSLRIMFLRLICVRVCISVAYISFAGCYSIICTYNILCIHPPADGPLGCFYLLYVINNPPTDIPAQIFVWTCFNFSWVDT